MLNNRYVIYNQLYRTVFLMLFCIIGIAIPAFAQEDTTETPVITEPSEPVVEEQPVSPVEETPAATQDNPKATENPPNAITPPSTTTTTSEPVVIYEEPIMPAQNNRASINQAIAPEPVTEDANSDYNPFELVKNGNSFYNEPIVEEEEEEEPEVAEEEELEAAIVNVPVEERNIDVDSTNPFELIQNGNLSIFATTKAVSGNAKKKPIAKKKKKKSKKTRKPLFDSSKLNYEAFVKLFGLLVIMGFLSFLTNAFRNDLQKIYRAFTNSNMMVQLYREKGSLLNMPYVPLYILFAFTGGTFIYLAAEYYNTPILNSKGLSLLLCIVGIGGFYLFKHLLLKLISVIFPFGKEVNQYHFLIGIFNQITGLALIPLVTVIAFAPQNIKLFAIYGAIGVIGIIFLNRFIRSVVIGSKFIAFHKFHLIVYICTVEIAPIFIITKLLMG